MCVFIQEKLRSISNEALIFSGYACATILLRNRISPINVLL